GHGFVLGKLLDQDGARLGSVHALPPGMEWAMRELADTDAALFKLELAGATLREVVELIDPPVQWPGPDAPYAEWLEVRRIMATLRTARQSVRHELHRNAKPCLLERGIREPPDDLPDRLRSYEPQGRPRIRTEPDPDAAAESGRVIALSDNSVLLEAKKSAPKAHRPQHAPPLPIEMIKTHIGMWWFVPEGILNGRV